MNNNINAVSYTHLLKCIKKYNADIIVMAGFLCIVGQNIIKEYHNKIINIHPSIIPSFCGDGFYGLKVHKAASVSYTHLDVYKRQVLFS